MPQVGNKKFAYTAAGIRDAMKARKKIKQQMRRPGRSPMPPRDWPKRPGWNKPPVRPGGRIPGFPRPKLPKRPPGGGIMRPRPKPPNRRYL